MRLYNTSFVAFRQLKYKYDHRTIFVISLYNYIFSYIYVCTNEVAKIVYQIIRNFTLLSHVRNIGLSVVRRWKNNLLKWHVLYKIFGIKCVLLIRSAVRATWAPLISPGTLWSMYSLVMPHCSLNISLKKKKIYVMMI